MANTPLGITVDVTSKEITIVGEIAIREQVDVTITNLGTTTAANLTLRIKDRTGTTMAVEAGFTASGATAIGVLDLATTELVAYFASMGARATRTFKIGIWDNVTNDLLANDNIRLMNNPFTAGSDTSASNDATYIQREPANGSFRTDENGQHLQLWDSGISKWRTLMVYNGVVALGPGED